MTITFCALVRMVVSLSFTLGLFLVVEGCYAHGATPDQSSGSATAVAIENCSRIASSNKTSISACGVSATSSATARGWAALRRLICGNSRMGTVSSPLGSGRSDRFVPRTIAVLAASIAFSFARPNACSTNDCRSIHIGAKARERKTAVLHASCATAVLRSHAL